MRHKTNTRSSLFLMELIIAILFFSLASAVCLRMFAKSHQLSTEASARNQAVNQAGNVAELIRYDLENDTRTLADAYPEADILYSVVSDTNKSNADNSASDAKDTGKTSDTSTNIHASEVYNGSVIYFNKNWEACSTKQAVYELTIQAQSSSNTLRKYILSVYDLSEKNADSIVSDSATSDTDSSDLNSVSSDHSDAGCIYELPLSIHIAREVGAHE